MKEIVIKVLKKALRKKEVELKDEEIEKFIEIPRSAEMGDYAFPCFFLSEKLKDEPDQIALEIREKIGNEFYWTSFGKEGQEIQNIFSQYAGKHISEMEIWNDYLKRNLKFPFEAKISEIQERGILREGTKVSVLKYVTFDDLEGIIVKIIYEKKEYNFPVCDLDVIDKKSNNYKLQVQRELCGFRRRDE